MQDPSSLERHRLSAGACGYEFVFLPTDTVRIGHYKAALILCIRFRIEYGSGKHFRSQKLPGLLVLQAKQGQRFLPGMISGPFLTERDFCSRIAVIVTLNMPFKPMRNKGWSFNDELSGLDHIFVNGA